MKNSSDESQAIRDRFEGATAWELPTVSGRVANPRGDDVQQKNIDDVKKFEQNIREHLKNIKQQRQVPALTVEQIEAVQQQARDEAFKQGYEEGRQQLQQHAKQLQQAMAMLNKPLAETDAEIEQQMTDMVFTIAHNLMMQQLKIDHEPVLNLVQKTIQMLPVKNRELRVKLSPGDIELLQQNGIDTTSQDWQIIPDENLAVGGCIVETESARIDASMEQRIASLIDELFNGLQQPDMQRITEAQQQTKVDAAEQTNQPEEIRVEDSLNEDIPIIDPPEDDETDG